MVPSDVYAVIRTEASFRWRVIDVIGFVVLASPAIVATLPSVPAGWRYFGAAWGVVFIVMGFVPVGVRRHPGHGLATGGAPDAGMASDPVAFVHQIADLSDEQVEALVGDTGSRRSLFGGVRVRWREQKAWADVLSVVNRTGVNESLLSLVAEVEKLRASRVNWPTNAVTSVLGAGFAIALKDRLSATSFRVLTAGLCG